jgi:peroxiredoxin
MTRPRRTVLTISLLSLLGGPVSWAAAKEPPPPRLPGLTAASQGTTAYQLKMKALDGTRLDPATLKGKVLFLHYWTTYCGYCVEELPSIQRLWSKMRDRGDVAFLIVKKDNYDDSFEKVMKAGHYDFPIYTETGKSPEFPNAEVPVTYIVDRDGGIRFREAETANWDDPSVQAYLLGLARSPSAQ